VSDNIRVLSVVGRFLEHSRAYWFENDGAPELYLSSADWMERNFFRRVEIAFPVLHDEHRKRIFKDLETLLSDNTNAWELQADGTLCAPELQPVDTGGCPGTVARALRRPADAATAVAASGERATPLRYDPSGHPRKAMGMIEKTWRSISRRNGSRPGMRITSNVCSRTTATTSK